jgi:hypothetical protein
MKGGGSQMNNNDFVRLLLGVGIGLVILNSIAEQPWCGPTCQVVMSDVRGTLIQDLTTGLLHWI